MAVLSHDSSLDPVGPCIGMRGSRVQAVVGELQGEKIDIIQWSDDPAMFIVNALAPAEVAKVVLDEERNKIEVVVPDDQLSLAIGRRGQNVRLGSQLSGWDIDILTEAEESERRTNEFQVRSQMFVDALDVDEVIAHLLVTEGFSKAEEVAFVPAEDLIDIEGFDEDVAAELQQRARLYLASRDQILEDKRKELGVSDDVSALHGVTADMLVVFGKNKIKSLDDLADLAGDELLEMVGNEVSGMDQANEIIMAARAHWFNDEQAKLDDTVSPKTLAE
jgi:N utilization substance protein A